MDQLKKGDRVVVTKAAGDSTTGAHGRIVGVFTRGQRTWGVLLDKKYDPNQMPCMYRTEELEQEK